MATDFIANTTARIAARNLRAEPVLAELSGMRRVMAKGSLNLANGVDRFGGWMSDGAAAVLAGALFGTVRGALAGGALFMVAAGLSISIAPLIGGVVFGGYLLHDAARSYNRVKADDPRYSSARRADWIASKGGALGATRAPNPNQTIENRHTIRQIKAQNAEAKSIARTTDLEPESDMTYPGGIVPSGFVEREMQRRSNPSPTASKNSPGL